MKKMFFVSFPAEGHINPALKLFKELSDKNIKIIFYATEDYFKRFEGMKNIELRSYPKEFVKQFEVYTVNSDSIARNFSAVMHMLYHSTDMLMPFMMEEVKKEKPDMMMCDAFGVWGKVAARYNNIPLAFFNAFFVQTPPWRWLISIFWDLPTLFESLRIKRSIDKKYNNFCDGPQDFAADRGFFTVLMTSRHFQPNGDKFKDNVKFLGPPNTEDVPLNENRDTIFISYGTVGSSDTFWDTCIEATKDLGYNVVLTLGGNKHNKVNRNKKYDNVKIYDKLTFEEYKNVMKRSVLCISHGGFNSISDAIMYKAPLLMCPDMGERYANAKVAERHNCGRVYPVNKINVKNLKKACIEIIADESIKEGLRKCRESYLKSMGYKKVAEALVKEFDLEGNGHE